MFMQFPEKLQLAYCIIVIHVVNFTVQLLDIFSTSCAWLVCGSSFRAIDHFIPCDMITPVMI